MSSYPWGSWTRPAVLIMAVGIAPPALWAQAQHLTLDRAVEIALRDSPALRAVVAGQDLAQARLAEAKAGRLPLLQFSEAYTHSNNPVFVFGSRLEQGRFGPQNFALDALNEPGSLSNFRSALSLRLPVFDRFQIRAQVEQARLGLQQAGAQHELAKQQIRFAVIQVYYGILVAQVRKQVADEAAATAEAEVKRIRDLHEQGLVVISDLLAMQVQLADFRQQQIQAEGDIIAARAALSAVMGEPAEPTHPLADELADRTFAVPSQEEILRAALELRADYRQSLLEVERCQEGLRAARGQYWPDLNLFASFGASSHNLRDGSSDYAIGASLTVNLLDRGREARVRQALAAKKAAEAQRDRKASEMRLEVVRALQGFRAAQERLKVASEAVDQAAAALRIAQDRHGVGLTTVTELLRAQTALVRARMNLSGARYEYYVGYAQTMLAAGQLTSVAPFTT